MKILIIISALLIFCIYDGKSQFVIHKENLQKHISILASDSLKGRRCCSIYEEKSAYYIRDYFKELGLVMLADNGLQSFPYSSIYQNKKSQNVVAKIEGADSILKKECIVIGAHYDHVGEGKGRFLISMGHSKIHRGADDNASGTAMIMEIARVIKEQNIQFKRSIIFVAFGCEEVGLIGSRYFVNNIPKGTGRIVTMINFDMIGRMNKRKDGFIFGYKTSDEFQNIFADIPNPDNMNIKFFNNCGLSDEASFDFKRIPVISFITGIHNDYHTPRDIESKINYKGMQSIGNYAFQLINKLANYDSTYTYNENMKMKRNSLINYLIKDLSTRGAISTKPWSLKGFYIGVNTLTDKNLNFIIPSEYGFLKPTMEKSIQFGWIFFARNYKMLGNLGICFGLGMESNRLYFKNSTPLAIAENRVIADSSFVIQKIDLMKNIFSDSRFVLPVMIEFSPKDKNSYYMATGITGSLIFSDKIYIRYNHNNMKIETSLKNLDFINRFNYSVTTRLGYRAWGIYINYQLSSFFKKENIPTIYPFTAGITINLRI